MSTRVRKYRHVRPYADSMKDYGRRLNEGERAYLKRFEEEFYFNTLDRDPEKRLHQNPGKDGQQIWVNTNRRNEDLFSIKGLAAPGYPGGYIVQADHLDPNGPVTAETLYGPASELDPEQALLLKEATGGEGEEDLSGTSPKEVSLRFKRRDGSIVTVKALVSLYGQGRLVRDIRVTDQKGVKAHLDSDEHLEVVALLKQKRPRRK